MHTVSYNVCMYKSWLTDLSGKCLKFVMNICWINAGSVVAKYGKVPQKYLTEKYIPLEFPVLSSRVYIPYLKDVLCSFDLPAHWSILFIPFCRNIHSLFLGIYRNAVSSVLLGCVTQPHTQNLFSANFPWAHGTASLAYWEVVKMIGI